MKFVRPVVATVGGIGSTIRDARRLKEVATVLARHGLGHGGGLVHIAALGPTFLLDAIVYTHLEVQLVLSKAEVLSFRAAPIS